MNGFGTDITTNKFKLFLKILATIVFLIGFFSVIYYQLSGLKLHFFHESAYPLLYADTIVDTKLAFSARFGQREISPISWPLVGSLLLLIGGKVSLATHSVLAILFSLFVLATGYLYCRVAKFSFYTTLFFLTLVFINFGPIPSRYLWTDQVWVWPMNSYGVYDFFSLICLSLVLIVIQKIQRLNCSTGGFNFNDILKTRAFILTCIIFFLASLNGTRGFLTIGGPVVVALSFDYLAKKDPFNRKYLNAWLSIIVILGISILGVIIITLATKGIPQPLQDRHKFATLASWDDLRDRLAIMPYNWLTLFNAIPKPGITMFSAINITRIFNSLFALLILTVPFFRLGKLKKESQQPERIAIYRYCFILLLLIVANIYGTSSGSPRYLIPLAYSALFVVPFYFESWLKRRKYGLVLVITLLVVPAYFNSVSMLTNYSVYEYKNNFFYKLGNFLEGNGLVYGYAGPWHTDVLTVNHFSKSKVRIVLLDIEPIGRLTPHEHVDKKWLDENYHIGTTFLALPVKYIDNNQKVLDLTKSAIKTLYYEDWAIYVFPYNIAKILR